MDAIKQAETKEIMRILDLRRTRKLLETKQESHQMDTNMVCFPSKIGPFLKWTREELQQMDQRTRKLTTMPKVLLQQDIIDRLCVKKKKKKKRKQTLKIATVHQYEDWKTTLKRTKKD